MNVEIYASNPFLKNYHFKSTIDNPIFYQELNNILNPTEFGFVISYRFGELKTQLKKTTKSIVNDDLIQGETGGAK